MPRVIAALLRHAAYRQPQGVPSAHLPYPLTEQGASQAETAAEELAYWIREQGWQVDCIIDSARLLRAWQTAKILSEVFTRVFERTYVVAEYDALAERCLGSMANLTMDEIDAVMTEDPRYAPPPRGWKRDNRYKLPYSGAESLEEAGARVARHLEARTALLAADVRDDTVKMYVGHGGAFRLAAVKLGILDAASTAGLSMYHCRPVLLERRAEGDWAHVGGDWKVRDADDREID